MLSNYLTIALRTLRKHPLYTTVNIFGLALGLACGIVIFLVVQQDLAFDRFHTKADRTVRVLTIDEALGVTSTRVGITLPALGPTMEAELPEVVETVRMLNQGRTLLRRDDRTLYAESAYLAEPSFFRVFDFPLRAGDPATALAAPGSIVLTPALAHGLFGEADPIGQQLRTGNGTEVTVTGILEPVPAASHLQFDALAALVPSEEQQNFAQFLTSWNSISMITYAVLDAPESAQGLNTKLNAILRANDVGENFSITTQPLVDTHLRSSDILFDTQASAGDLGYVIALAAVGLFILLIAAFNFMNLSTARSAERAKETGLRKVVGASRAQLIGQHLGESLLLCGLAFALALVLVQLTLPTVSRLLGRPLTLDVLADPMTIAAILGMALVVAFIAGSYPAFVLSRFEPAAVLKGTFKTGTQGIQLRKVLVVTQFTASVILIVGATVAGQQLRYIQEKNLGYDREQVLVLTLNNQDLQAGATTFRRDLLRTPAIRSAGRSTSMPGQTFGRTGIVPEGASDDDTWITSILTVDDGFLNTLGMQIVAGRGYNTDYGADADASILINEAAARALGWTEPLGKTITLGQQERTVVGVVGDFHFASVRHQIEPLIVLYQPPDADASAGPGPGLPFLALKIDTQNLDATLATVEQAWAQHFPDHPFEYSFLNDTFEQQYRAEANFATLTQGFTGLAVFIACLGLFGLAAFMAEQRTREIGVRKTLGASASSIVLLLSKEFALLVGIAVVLATPIAYLAMQRWLADFAYRIDLSWGVFALAGAGALAIALLSVSYQALRAALTDPVNALRYE